MVAPFTYVANPARVVFGAGRLAELGAELDRLAVRRTLLLSTPEQAGLAEAVAGQLGNQAGGIYSGATMHTPTDVTADAMAQLQALGCDGLVALGGGSTIGPGKALALRTDVPQVAVLTTYAGSEMTPILGETEGGRKTTQRTPKVLPETVIYDVELTLSLPPGLSVTSGVNALAHAVEVLYARREPDHFPDGRGRHRRASAQLAPHHRRAWRLRRAGGGAVRDLAARRLSGRGRHGLAPQGLPRAGRHLRFAARRNPHRHAAARGRLQRGRGAACAS